MPSPIAHSVAGYLLAKSLPADRFSENRIQKWSLYIFYASLIAVVADLDFIPQFVTGNAYHRGITHSLVFALGFSAISALIVSVWKKFSYIKIFTLTSIFYGSHLLLDYFSYGRGIKLFLPFVDRFFRSPIILFPGLHYSRGLFHISHLLPIGFEIAISILGIGVVWWWKKSKARKNIEV
ncbi:metal-dependent hydrolase [Oscillatoriales cyanobacterium LEGE 11467]|uniref:Metal-dependent hydrolase n=1 Tax=Zarconia navalis LEGE 11467 TaxID=1828826 RepID=A0A928Z6C8_9CYAN|nr:metal-dependent hydrolase [Zarconia navalis]MBE9039340.1 metal-dependent hydrolase [Zarconia navalis LEGE 11467]